MKKYILSFGLIIAFAFYIALQSQSSFQVNGSTGGGTPTSSSSSSSAPTSAPQPTSTALYKDGSYTGSAADAYYGTVQVEAMVSGGRIADIKILQEPDAPGHTTEVNQIAVPRLVQEAVSTQSANINIISGATQTSEAFIRSLASALSQAQT